MTKDDILSANEIGIRIRKRRKSLYLTGQKVNDMAGIAITTLSEIERGLKYPSVDTLLKLSEVLDCSCDWILKGIEKPAPEVLLTEPERNILEKFRKLSNKDQYEILEIIKLKDKLANVELRCFYEN